MIKYQRINSDEREVIAILKSHNYPAKRIAELIERSVSSVTRELKRNSQSGVYRAFPAHYKAGERQRYTHSRKRKIDTDETMRSLILEKLRLFWSPKQISTWLKTEMEKEISHEAIYQYIYLLGRGELKKELISCLRQRKPLRQNRKGVTEKRGTIADMITIHERPEEVADRTVPGHWEGDLIMGKDHKSAIGTIVERQTRYVLLVKLKEKDAKSVRKAFAKKLKELPESLRKTMTYDRGKEMAEHKKFTLATGIKVYFCDPHSPWQRGTCENTNGLIRNFFPKGTDFGTVTKDKLQWVQEALNERPRETLQYKTPKQKLNLLISEHQNFALAR
jgi:IS30 family transposase